MRDDVVQLLRDAHALLGHRAVGQQLALAVHPRPARAARRAWRAGRRSRGRGRPPPRTARRRPPCRRNRPDARRRRRPGRCRRRARRSRRSSCATARRGDRVEDDQDGQRSGPIGLRDDRSHGGDGTSAANGQRRRNRTVRDRRRTAIRPPARAGRRWDRARLRRCRSSARRRTAASAMSFVRSRRAVAPIRAGPGTRAERIPGPVARGSDLAGAGAPCAGGEGGDDPRGRRPRRRTPSVVCTSERSTYVSRCAPARPSGSPGARRPGTRSHQHLRDGQIEREHDRDHGAARSDEAAEPDRGRRRSARRWPRGRPRRPGSWRRSGWQRAGQARPRRPAAAAAEDCVPAAGPSPRPPLTRAPKKRRHASACSRPGDQRRRTRSPWAPRSKLMTSPPRRWSAARGRRWFFEAGRYCWWAGLAAIAARWMARSC